MKFRIIIPELIFLGMSAIFLSSCSEVPQIGVIKNVTNGISTNYKNIKTEEVIRVMNGEEIQHNQIPLGESFQVISKEVTGLTEVNNQVKVGCELTVSDKLGNVLLHATDLFEDNGTFHKDSAEFLRCTVNTGSPMKWQEKYDVEVRYWDKQGDGELVSNMEIEIIDEP